MWRRKCLFLKSEVHSPSLFPFSDGPTPLQMLHVVSSSQTVIFEDTRHSNKEGWIERLLVGRCGFQAEIGPVLKQNMSETKTVFVTVGTYKFDELVEAVTEKQFQEMLMRKGYTHMVVQIGNGTCEPEGPAIEDFHLDWYRFKPSLKPDMSEASLIISHGGVGCIMESLELRKPLVVAINTLLMSNHQMELADQLSKDGHLLYTTCSNLHQTIEEMDELALTKYTPGNPRTFGHFLNTVMGFDRTE